MNLSQELDKTVSKKRKSNIQVKFLSVLFYPILIFVVDYLIKLKIFKGTKGFVKSVVSSLDSFVLVGDSYISNKRKKQL